MEIGLGRLGWSPTEFWAATRPELLWAYRGLQESDDLAFIRTGTLIAEVHNMFAGQGATRLRARDVFPHLYRQDDD